jgi:hypothetical protein
MRAGPFNGHGDGSKEGKSGKTNSLLQIQLVNVEE